MPPHATRPGMLVSAIVVLATPSLAAAGSPVASVESDQAPDPASDAEPKAALELRSPSPDPAPTAQPEDLSDPAVAETEPVPGDAPDSPDPTAANELPSAPSSAPEDGDDPQADRDGRTLMAAGLSLLGGSYFNMLTGGLTQLHTGSPAVGRRMFVPLVGPFFAAARVDRVSLQVMLSVAALAQLAGLTKVIIGGVRYARSVKEQPERALSVMLAPTPTGGGATLRYRF